MAFNTKSKKLKLKNNYPTHSKKKLGNFQKYTKYNRLKNKQKHFYSI